VHEVSRVARHANAATDGRAVEILLRVGEFPVERSTADFFFGDLNVKTRRPRLCARFRRALRLIAARRGVEFVAFHTSSVSRRHL
jgi:hypothetical protein